MTSEKRLAANRRNAQRSTGPRTPQGKDQSRQNSLKHGLTGNGIVVAYDVEAKLKEQEQAFAESAQPANVYERTMVSRMALASVRMELCKRAESSRRKARTRRAAGRFERVLVRSLEQGIALFEEDPGEAVKELEATSLGCRWMIDQWKALEQTITSGGFWAADQFAQAFALVDFALSDDETATRTRLCHLALVPDLIFDEADHLLGIDTSSFTDEARLAHYAEMLPDAERARKTLRSFAQIQITRLEALCERLETEVERPELNERMMAVEIDSSPDGMRLARYDAMNEMTFHRNWNALQRLRKLGPESLGIQPDELQAQNEPNGEASSHYSEDTYASSHELNLRDLGRDVLGTKPACEPSEAASSPFEAISPGSEPAELAVMMA